MTKTITKEILLRLRGEIINVGIKYVDGEEEECNWPADDIVIIGRELVREKKSKEELRLRQRKKHLKIGCLVVESQGVNISQSGRIFLRAIKRLFMI